MGEFSCLNVHCGESGQTHSRLSESLIIPLTRKGNLGISNEKKNYRILIEIISLI